MKPFVLFAAALSAAVFVSVPTAPEAAKPTVCAECVKANLEHLAGDDLKGRACGTADENAAARYIADTLKREKIAGGLGDGGYLQPVQLLTPTVSAPPTLELSDGATHLSLLQGRDMAAMNPPEALGAPMVRVTDTSGPLDAVKGKLVIFDPAAPNAAGPGLLSKAGAVAVVSVASGRILDHWSELANRPARIQIVGVEPRPSTNAVTIFVKPEIMTALRSFTQGEATLAAPRGTPRASTTYSVVGVLHGRAADADRRAVLLTAHYDHLGVRNGVIFHGANDDASGTAAVLEFARVLGAGRKPQRTVYFALFGCEETGSQAAQYFLAHPPMALDDLSLNLEFEMIGVDDPKRPGALMLTGWDRTNVGPTLAAHGARVGPDLYPEQNFFQRSDNYTLARRGVVAQTISAWPVPPTYHAASDDLAHVNLAFMDTVIGSLVTPLTWLLDSDFQPAWLPGKKP